MFWGRLRVVCTKQPSMLRREVHLWTAHFPESSGASLTCGAVSFESEFLTRTTSNRAGTEKNDHLWSPFILRCHAEGYVVNHRASAAVNKQPQDDPLLVSEMDDDGRLFFQGDAMAAMACLDDDNLCLVLKARLTVLHRHITLCSESAASLNKSCSYPMDKHHAREHFFPVGIWCFQMFPGMQDLWFGILHQQKYFARVNVCSQHCISTDLSQTTSSQ